MRGKGLGRGGFLLLSVLWRYEMRGKDWGHDLFVTF